MIKSGIFTLLLGLSICLMGCGDTKHASGSYHRLLILAIDRSGSTEAARAQILASINDFAGDLDGDTRLILLRFGRSVEEVYDGIPDDEDSFALLLAKTLKQSDPQKGTDYPKLLQSLANYAKQAKESQIDCLVAGDGGNDFEDAPHRRLYRDSAIQLASNPHVEAIKFWGVEVGAREELRLVFKGHDSKLKLSGIDEPLL